MKKIVLFFSLVFLSANEREIPIENFYKTELKIKDRSFTLWLALNPKQQREGLSSLDINQVTKDKGMLFIYPFNEIQTFWMKETLINLDIAFIDEEGIISDIYKMKNSSMKCFSSTKPIRYVLELREGVFQELNLTVGERIDFPLIIKEFS